MTIETDINLMEHAGRTWRFVLKNEGGTILPLDNFMIYGAAACPGQAPRAFEVRVDAGVAVARMPGLPLTDYPWTYQLFAQEKSSRVEWLLCHGAVNLHGRVAGGRVVLDPELLEFTGVLDSTTHTAVMVIGESTLSISENVARAIQEAQTAKEKATEAGEHAAAADKAAQTAGEKATEAGEHATAAGKAADEAHEQATAAEASATDAANSASAAAGEVTKAAAEVEKAAAEVEKAKLERETAATHATAAAQSSQDAKANQQGAEQAAQNAAQAQVAAETAKSEAEAAKLAAQTSEQNAKASADATAADKTAAEKAKADALAAQSKAEVEAQNAAENAALLGDAALQVGDNAFTGNNSHSGTEVFNGAVAFNDTVTLAGDIYAGSKPLPAGSAGLLRLAVESFLDGVTSIVAADNSWGTFASFGITKFPDDTVTLRNAETGINHPTVFNGISAKKLIVKLPKLKDARNILRGSKVEAVRLEAPAAEVAMYAFFTNNNLKSVEVIAQKLTKFSAQESDEATWLAFIPQAVTRCRVVLPAYKGGSENNRLFSWDAKLDALSVRQMFESITEEDGTEWPAGLTNWDDGAEHHILISMSKAAAADAEVMRLFGTTEPIQSVSSTSATEPAYQVNGWIVRVHVR